MNISQQLIQSIFDKAPRGRKKPKRIALERRIAMLRQKMKKTISTDLQAPMALLDEAIRFVIEFENFQFSRELPKDTGPFILQISKIRVDLISIRELILLGQESSAYSIGRVFIEDIELAMAFAIDPDFAHEYQLSESGVDFWSKRIGYGRIYPYVERFLKAGQITPDTEQVSKHLNTHRQLKSFLSQHIHPSFSSAFNTAFSSCTFSSWSIPK